jgi:hypothetical protein
VLVGSSIRGRRPVWFEHRLELDAIDRSADGHDIAAAD